MKLRKSGGYYWLAPISNLLIPYGFWGVHILWGKAAVPGQPCYDAPTRRALCKSSLTGGVASKRGLPWLSQQALPNNVAGAYTVVGSQLAAIWEQMPSGCQIVILSFSILPSFCELAFGLFFPREEMCLSQNTSDLSPVKEMKVWVTITSGETISKSQFKCFVSTFFPL